MRRAVVFVTLVAASRCLSVERPLETFGDSLTQGFLTNSYVEMSNPDEVRNIMGSALKYFITKKPEFIAPYIHPELAWPTHLTRLIERDTGVRFQILNYARSGANTRMMFDQVQRAPTQKQTPITFFFIGHNDLCSSTEGPEAMGGSFARQFNRSVEVWDARNQGATAYFVPVAEVHRVFEVMKDYIWYTGAFGEYRCTNSWKTYFPYCRNNYKRFQEGTLRDHLEPRITAMNARLQDLATHWDKTSKRNRYRFLAEVKKVDVHPRHFAVDCYHLSSTGQRELAEHIYDAIRGDF